MKYIINTEVITDYIRTHNLSQSKFCEKCVISYTVYKKIMKNQTNFRIKALFKIAKQIGIHIKYLLINNQAD